LNWEFQWYSHWVRGDLDASGKTSEMARIYGSTASAARTLAQKMWDGCQAHGANEDEDFFLPWHRMFVFAFENIIRAVSGDAAFTLPYWDYTDAAAFAIPAQFRLADDPTWGPLYRSARNPGVNAGQPIADDSSLNLSILSEDSYSANGGDAGFCQGLDNGLHGAVHVAVGDSTNGMGVVPWAANDPIFWLHHCNIDRIWASWNAAGHANPSDASFLNKPFPFADPMGAEVDYVVSQFLDIATVGYSYDALAGGITAQTPPAPSPPAPSPQAVGSAAPQAVESAQTQSAGPAAPQMQMRVLKRAVALPTPPQAAPVVTHASEGVALGEGAVRVQLAQAAAAPDVAARAVQPLLALSPRLLKHAGPTVGAAPPMTTMSAPPAPPAAQPPSLQKAAPLTTAGKGAGKTAAPGPGQKTFIVISDLSTTIQPGVLYTVYLEAPGAGGAAQPFFVGVLNFFSAMGPGMRMSGRKVSFDITALAGQLAKEGRLPSSPTLVFVPKGRPLSQAQPLIGSVSVVVQ
jgi:hypothetical protein